MKREKLFVGILIFTIWLAGCTNEVIEPPSKTTTVREIALIAYYYPPEAQYFWTGGWESSLWDKDLLLSNLLPDGQIKNNTEYEITIAGTLTFEPNKKGTKYEKMDAFQYVFAMPGPTTFAEWVDLVVEPSAEISTPAGSFYTKGILKTTLDATENFEKGALAFTNRRDVPEDDNNDILARFTNVEITITEK